MSDRLDERLMYAKERVRSKQKLESMMRQLQATVDFERTRCSTLKVSLKGEQADVDKLEGLSLTGLFYSVLGTKNERLEKERQEFLTAKLKSEEAAAALEDAQQEVKRVRSELNGLSNVAAEYQQLIREKEKLVAGASGKNAEELLAMAEELADLNSDQKELQEAVQAGQAALSSLRQVSSDLGSAANWGTWDMLGGGVISTMAKHSKIDSAKQHAHRAQRKLRRFQEELADADRRLHISLEIDGFSKFADIFFDGLIADWIVQSKIQNASSACSSTISRVTAAINECRRRLTETEAELDRVTRARQEFIERA